MGLDPVSAYLAATPGGLDSVAAVAAELQGDTAVILTVHLVRLLCVAHHRVLAGSGLYEVAGTGWEVGRTILRERLRHSPFTVHRFTGVRRSAFGALGLAGKSSIWTRRSNKIRGRWSFFDGLGRVFDASGDFLDCLLVELVSGIEGPCVVHRSAFGAKC
jgi:hypothetical protein